MRHGFPGCAVLAMAACGLFATPSLADLTVDATPVALRTGLGRTFVIHTVTRNDAPGTSARTILHLNIVSLDPGTYVDPEDWSSTRTRYLHDIPANGVVTTSWTVQAVNSGRFKIFVVVTSAAGGDEVVSSPALRVTIADQRRLNPSGILPVVLVVPATVALGLAWSRRRRRRLR